MEAYLYGRTSVGDEIALNVQSLNFTFRSLFKLLPSMVATFYYGAA